MNLVSFYQERNYLKVLNRLVTVTVDTSLATFQANLEMAERYHLVMLNKNNLLALDQVPY